MFWAPWHQIMLPTLSRIFFSFTRKTGGVWMCKLGTSEIVSAFYVFKFKLQKIVQMHCMSSLILYLLCITAY